jgi:hypothetical protein
LLLSLLDLRELLRLWLRLWLLLYCLLVLLPRILHLCPQQVYHDVAPLVICAVLHRRHIVIVADQSHLGLEVMILHGHLLLLLDPLSRWLLTLEHLDELLLVDVALIVASAEVLILD